MDNLTPDQIKAMIMMLQNMLPQQTSDGDNIVDDNEIEHTASTKRNTKTGKKTKSATNKFNNMPEMHMHKDDIAIDKKLRTQPPVPRARPFKLIKVVCRVCGKREEVNPGLILESVDRYKCNKCSTSSG